MAVDGFDTVVDGMVLRCRKLWTALQILWSTVYIICGALQLMAAIFFLVTFREMALYGVMVAGSWNILIGIAGAVWACIKAFTLKKQEALLYLAMSILIVNTVAVVFTEWKLYFTDLQMLTGKYTNHVLVESAVFVLRVAVSTVIVISFLDSQLTFCSLETAPTTNQQKSRRRRRNKKGSHEQVSDIEYIIPRSNSTKPHQVYDAYAQSWVFDSENVAAGSSDGVTPNGMVKNGNPKNPLGRPKPSSGNEAHVIDNPVVHVEEASDDSTSNSDRKLCHMKSFSRSASPVILSESSSQISLNNYTPTQPQIYQHLEKLTEPQIYRSRLDTAVSTKSQDEELPQYQAPMHRRTETGNPQVVEPVQYASLMKELQKVIVHKKDPSSSVTSPLSTSETQSHSKSSDAEFSKELEAALQLIQDLESPNTTGETPSSDPPISRPLAVWRKDSEPSGSEKTLSAVGSMTELPSPLTSQENGKGARVVVRYSDSQSTSGYSSPSHGPTPTNWSTTSSINGRSCSSIDISRPVSYHIHNAKLRTVISLYAPPSINTTNQSKGKSVSLVKINGQETPVEQNQEIIKPVKKESRPAMRHESILWNVKSLLRKKKVAKLCPELEGAIVKSESLAYLTEVELLARARRNEEIQRQIEEKVIQQLGVPRVESESNC